MHKRPVVHAGFLRCWLADGLHKRVIQRLLDLAAEWEASYPGQPVPVLLTGQAQTMSILGTSSASAQRSDCFHFSDGLVNFDGCDWVQLDLSL